MKRTVLAVLVALTAACSRNSLPARVVEGKAPVKAGSKIFFKANGGAVKIVASKTGEATWRVELKPDGDWSGAAATEKDYDSCKVAFEPGKGLTVETTKGIGAKIVFAVPDKEALDADLTAGILDIGPRAGATNAFIDAGILNYDASALPAKVCVSATINEGAVNNRRDRDCASTGATLHGHSGVITVN